MAPSPRSADWTAIECQCGHVNLFRLPLDVQAAATAIAQIKEQDCGKCVKAGRSNGLRTVWADVNR